MNVLSVLDHIVSLALVIICWWLAHQNSGGKEPFSGWISAGYGLLAMAVMASLLFHNITDLRWLMPYAALAERGALAVTLGAVAVRLAWLYAPPDH